MFPDEYYNHVLKSYIAYLQDTREIDFILVFFCIDTRGETIIFSTITVYQKF